ncbi:MAG TPA: outer membrane lipoprotein carrier protein LolA [Polyangiaceae bacterium]|jgi:outer membrane lipoprotein carrier protein|nr:outer membrane lipoprotein carrier protein LolA [Polyangiaceae bacterium]
MRPLSSALLAAVIASGLAQVASAAPDPAPSPPAVANPGDPTPEAIADRVQAFYDRTKTFAADFTQRYTIKAYNRTKDSRGKVVFEKPGKMSWRYASNGNRVVADGKLLRVYEDENKQMYEQPMDQSQYPAALSFLLGGGSVKKSFTLQKLDGARLGFTGGWVLKGEPKEPTPAYQTMLLYVDSKTSQVRRVMLIDAQGNRNRFDFLNPVVNEKTLPDEFKFVPPKGTKVIKP